jgi:hypothetical protein
MVNTVDRWKQMALPMFAGVALPGAHTLMDISCQRDTMP